MVEPEYWYNPATLAEKSYNRCKSSTKNVIFLPNGNDGGGVSNLLCNGCDLYRQLQQVDEVDLKSSVT